MCLLNSVGRGAANKRPDVKTVQLLLNMSIGQLVPLAPLTVDGRPGAATYGAISEYQRRVLRQANPDGRIDPTGTTLKRLKAGIDPLFTAAKLQGIMINADEATISRFLTPLINTMAAYTINTTLRMAHFLAQLAHESGDLRYNEELSSGQQYEGRADLGNTQPGDGMRFKGRGLIQLTGRANYKAYGDESDADYTLDSTAPLIATDPELAADVAGWYWNRKRLNDLADIDDINAITKKVNGGYYGLDDRKSKLARAKFFLVRDP